MITVKLPSATLNGLELNGDSYISNETIDESVFSDLSQVEITDSKTGVTEVKHNLRYIPIASNDGKFWFAFEEKSSSEIFAERVEAAVSAAEDAIEANSDDLTDVQMALADIYEMILGGM